LQRFIFHSFHHDLIGVFAQGNDLHQAGRNVGLLVFKSNIVTILNSTKQTKNMLDFQPPPLFSLFGLLYFLSRRARKRNEKMSLKKMLS
jgi:phenylacetate-coenzyme A ligase PaaK-like adenylate-forming protein